MKKSEVYSWRVDPQMKQALEERARDDGTSMAKLLDRIVEDWLEHNLTDEETEEQRRLHAAAAKVIGSIRSGNPIGAENAGEIVAAAIEEKFERRRARRSPPNHAG